MGLNVDAIAGLQAAGENFGTYKTTKDSEKVNGAKSEKGDTQATDAVYEKSEAESKNAPYSINKMSKEERASLVQQLKEDQENRQRSLTELVQKMLGKQAETYGIAMGDDSIWKMFADGNFTVDEAAKAQAQEDISEDGYWGVKQTSQRLFDFASALAGDDVDKMRQMQAAMEAGFGQAKEAWGKDLPEISGKTLDAANALFEEYYKSKTIE